MRVKLWVEVLTTARMTEEIGEIPDDQWDAMNPAEREARMKEMWSNLQDEVANGGWEAVEGDEEEED